ncbi:MAG: ATP-binding protein [Caulobacteraceae bacterium]|nr:ATP-binding protein [Caulobacteraceae bacterium]
MDSDQQADPGSTAPARPGFGRRLVDWLRRALGGEALARAERQAREAEARLRAAIEAIPEGVVFLDAEGRYVLWNQRYAEIYHRSADLFAPGARLVDTLKIGVARGDYPDAIGREEEWLAERAAQLTNPRARHEQRVSDGRWLMLEERRTADGGLIGLRIDITDMKAQAVALEEALARAEAANRAKNDFLANMSHEIRTPLNGVMGLAEVLARTRLDDQQREMLSTMVASAGALNQLLSDLLDFNRLEAGKIEIVSEPFALDQVVAEAAGLFAHQARAKGLEFEVRISDEARRRVVGDPARIKQILTNLLSNALKFTPGGRVALTVAPSAIDDRCYFEVRDTGVGFDPHDADRLFGRFEQADGSITRKYGGTGLGLAICRQLASLMGGAISAAGQPGRGAVFTLMLPLPLAEPEPDEAREDAAVAADASSLRVLVADDNPTNRMVAELILSAVGADIVSVENGRQAVEAVEATPFDVVLMDLQMPEMDGLTAIRMIRARESGEGTRRTPIVVLSANVMRDHIEASAAAGADGHLGKPFRAEELISTVVRAAQAESRAAIAAA